ncbi:MAG: PilZ domain-containing protein [Candidatus Methylomirabilales bacterium]
MSLEHIMFLGTMGRTDNRQDPRLPLRIPVRCESAAVPGYRTLGLTHNVSRNGLLVEVQWLVARGTPTDLRLLTGDRIADAKAVVVWTAEASPGRMGMKLTGMAESDAAAWERLLAFQGGPVPRSSLRIRIDLEVTCIIPPDTRLKGRVENLSAGGLLVVLPREVPPRTLFKVEGPAWLTLPPIGAEVVWTRAGLERDGVLHGVRILSGEVGKEIYLIGSMIRMLLG